MVHLFPSLLLSCIVSYVAAHGDGFAIQQSKGQINFHFGQPPVVERRNDDELTLRKRQSCGPSIGSCPKGQCCAASGLCGTGTQFCQGPQCLTDYSDSCDSLIPPPGASTASILRPKIGSVPYGLILNDCVTPGTLALTFDDGPNIYTSQLLDILEKLNVKATFFICGKNAGKGRIDDPTTPWPAILKRMYSKGHQLASHSYTHEDFTVVNPTIQRSQVIYNEMAFRNIFGWIPTYFRPPYTFCTAASGCPALLNELGYHIIHLDVDTKDYLNDDPSLIQTSKDNFDKAVSSDAAHHSYIELSHDTHYNTVINLTAFMIQTSLSRGYRLVTVGECLGDPSANWYRDAGGIPENAGAVAPSSATPSTSTSTSAPLPSTSSKSSSSSSSSSSIASTSSSSKSTTSSSTPTSTSSSHSTSTIPSSTSLVSSSSTSVTTSLLTSSGTNSTSTSNVVGTTTSSSSTSSTSVAAAAASTTKTSGGNSLIWMGWSTGTLLGTSLGACLILF